MHPSSVRAAAFFSLCAAVSFVLPIAARAQGTPSIQRVQVLRGKGQVEIEIEASARIVPQTNVITGPDRLIVDFVNARPGALLRNQAVNRPEVKSLRVGLFSLNPPVTRIVMDLNGRQAYQVFPSGKTIIVKVGAPGVESARTNSSTAPELVSITYPSSGAATPGALSAPIPAQVASLAPAKPGLLVSFRDGLLSINSDDATLSEVLFAVHQRTGAEIPIPAGAEQEKVAVHLGPAPAPEVLAHLLNGSKFNFLILSSASNPNNLDQVILSPRGEGSLSAPSPQLRPLSAEEEQAIQTNQAPPPPPTENQGPPPADDQAPAVPPQGDITN